MKPGKESYSTNNINFTEQHIFHSNEKIAKFQLKALLMKMFRVRTSALFPPNILWKLLISRAHSHY